MLNIVIIKMAEVHYSALVCNLSDLSSTEHPDQHNNRGKKKRISASKCLMLPPNAMITFAHTHNQRACLSILLKFQLLSSLMLPFLTVVATCGQKNSMILIRPQDGSQENNLCEDASLFQWVKQNNYS